MMLPKFLATELSAGPEQIGIVVAVPAISIAAFLLAAFLISQTTRRRERSMPHNDEALKSATL